MTQCQESTRFPDAIIILVEIIVITLKTARQRSPTYLRACPVSSVHCSVVVITCRVVLKLLFFYTHLFSCLSGDNWTPIHQSSVYFTDGHHKRHFNGKWGKKSRSDNTIHRTGKKPTKSSRSTT